MNALHRSKKLLSSLRFLSGHSGVSRSFGSAFNAFNSSPRLPLHPASHLSSCQRGQQEAHPLMDTRRLCSEVCSENQSVRSSGVLKEETAETDGDYRDRRQKSPESFSLDVLVSLLRQENAVDLCVIKVPEHVKYTEYFIVVSGISTRHISAMAFYALKVYKYLKKEEQRHVRIEGKDSEDWMCIDFGSMVCHFMLPETREIYELEKLWTLRSYDQQLRSIPEEKLPEDFIYDAEDSK